MNNRIIKFRAWDEERKEWMFPTSVKFLNEDKFSFSGEDSLILQQFTGLLDKNGKEIYEGDVVESLLYMFGADKSKRKDVVVFENGCFLLNGIAINNYVQESEGGLNFQPEIIGNIYENPELIQPHE